MDEFPDAESPVAGAFAGTLREFLGSPRELQLPREKGSEPRRSRSRIGRPDRVLY
jgi:hypothetical protein